MYRDAQVALVTPIRDGMNLVAKEYVASSFDAHGTLILSEFAGAAAQLGRGSLLVNPYDLDGVAEAIYTAFNMIEKERRVRMVRLRRNVQGQNVFEWVKAFLRVGAEHEFEAVPSPHPVVEDTEAGYWLDITG